MLPASLIWVATPSSAYTTAVTASAFSRSSTEPRRILPSASWANSKHRSTVLSCMPLPWSKVGTGDGAFFLASRR